MKFTIENWGVLLTVVCLMATVLTAVVGVFLLADAVLATVVEMIRR
jgi:hypothetical protein